MRLASSATVSSMIHDRHGQPRISATCAPVAPMSSSIAWRPDSTSCGLSSLTTAASARAAVSVSAPSNAGSFTWMARSAPIARHERSASLARSGPRVTATTSSAGLAPLLLDPEGLLERELVVGGDDPGDAGLVDRSRVAPDLDLRGGVRHLLHQDEHLHASGSFERCDWGDPGIRLVTR